MIFTLLAATLALRSKNCVFTSNDLQLGHQGIDDDDDDDDEILNLMLANFLMQTRHQYDSNFVLKLYQM